MSEFVHDLWSHKGILISNIALKPEVPLCPFLLIRTVRQPYEFLALISKENNGDRRVYWSKITQLAGEEWCEQVAEGLINNFLGQK